MLIYNYSRNEVCNYLANNAMFWLERYSLDWLRVDAIASMRVTAIIAVPLVSRCTTLYGDNENLEAIAFLRYTSAIPSARNVTARSPWRREESTSFFRRHH
ncbi:hypothetical protein [Sodalis-like endosymbiont of Proechinophthirus fluctus]|uniref:hypothetical protein n=1 Tax=Sodalis-like endosymbiont of Proechinophthirus fluctus TaxID=1462730 RepID=UPI000B097BA4|nr:hypothetical protein [Sodalis-like endosymbiont of Proechinophthirus fluctus]